MTIKASGTLALSEIQSEFGGANPISMSEYYRGGSYATAKPATKNSVIPAAGAISISNFFNTVKYTSGSQSWYNVGQFYWTAPAWVDTIYISGAGAGAGGGGVVDTNAIHDYGAAGGGSSGVMVSSYTYTVTPSATYGLYIGAPGGGGYYSGGNGQNTVFDGLVLRGGVGGGGGPVDSYQWNGHWYGGGSISGVGAPFYHYPGGGPYWSGGAFTGYDSYGNAMYAASYIHGGDGGNGWGNWGAGAGAVMSPPRSSFFGGSASGPVWGNGGSQHGSGGGGACCGYANGGQSAAGGSGVRGFIEISW